jgi:hypothetical protein
MRKMSSDEVTQLNPFRGSKGVETRLKDPKFAVKFYDKAETQALFKALDIAAEKWEQGIQKFDNSDRKDKYYNAYKMDVDLNFMKTRNLISLETMRSVDESKEENKDNLGLCRYVPLPFPQIKFKLQL